MKNGHWLEACKKGLCQNESFDTTPLRCAIRLYGRDSVLVAEHVLRGYVLYIA